MLRILIIEADADIAANVYDDLAGHRHAVDHAADNVTGLRPAVAKRDACVRLPAPFMQRPGHAFARAAAVAAAWGATLRSHMHLLRSAPVEAVHGLGYRLAPR